MAMGSIKHWPTDTFAPRRLGGRSIVGICIAGWLVGLLSMITSFASESDRQWARTLLPAIACGSIAAAVWATHHITRHRRALGAIPKAILETRYHGTLEVVNDCARRRLRSVGSTVNEIAARTDVMLGDLLENPGVRIFRGLLVGPVDDPPVSHAIVADRTVAFIESVSWPPGEYRIGSDGRISCSNVYIGQSVHTLMTAVRQWRSALPRSHRVMAFVIVYAAAEGRYDLPADSPELVFTPADEAITAIQRRIAPQSTLNRRAIAALVAAVSPRRENAGGEAWGAPAG